MFESRTVTLRLQAVLIWEKELNTIAIEVKESYTIASYLKNQIP
jgi:hypothetical protein